MKQVCPNYKWVQHMHVYDYLNILFQNTDIIPAALTGITNAVYRAILIETISKY